MSEPVGKTLWCGNLATEVNEDLLRSLFSQAGVLDSVFIPRNEMGVGNFAFITYRNAADVPFALYYFQGTRLLGRLMILRPSREITPFNRHLRFDNGNYVTRTHTNRFQDSPVPSTSSRDYGGASTERANSRLTTYGGGRNSLASSRNVVNEQSERQQVHPLGTSSNNGQSLAIEYTANNQNSNYLQAPSAFNVMQQPMQVQQETNYPSSTYGMYYSGGTSSQNVTENASTSARGRRQYPEPTCTQTIAGMEIGSVRQRRDGFHFSRGLLVPRHSSGLVDLRTTAYANSHGGELYNPQLLATYGHLHLQHRTRIQRRRAKAERRFLRRRRCHRRYRRLYSLLFKRMLRALAYVRRRRLNENHGQPSRHGNPDSFHSTY